MCIRDRDISLASETTQPLTGNTLSTGGDLKGVDKGAVSFNMLVLQCCRYALDHMRKDDE